MWCAAPIGRATPSRSIRPERRRAIYRFPGLGRSAEVEQYLATRGVMVWSADFPADDWKHISAKQVTARVLDVIAHITFKSGFAAHAKLFRPLDVFCAVDAPRSKSGAHYLIPLWPFNRQTFPDVRRRRGRGPDPPR